MKRHALLNAVLAFLFLMLSNGGWPSAEVPSLPNFLPMGLCREKDDAAPYLGYGK